METSIVEIIDEQIKIIKKDADLLPQNKVYKIEALEELRTIVSRVELPVKPATCERCKELEELLSKYKYDRDAYFNPHYCFGYLYSEYKQQKPRFEKLLGIGTHSYIIEQQVNTLLTILEGKLPSKLSV